MVDVLDLATNIATRDKLEQCRIALEKMQSARCDNWVAANKSSQVPVYVEFSVRYNRKLVKTGSWEATFKMLQQGKIPSTPMDYIASVRLACFRGDEQVTFAIKEHPPFVLTMTIPRDKKLEAPILYATISLQTRWSVKEVRQDTSLAWSMDDDHSSMVSFHSWQLGRTDPGDTKMMNGYFVVEKGRAQLYIPPPPVGPTDESEVDQEPSYVKGPTCGTSGETAVYTSLSNQPLPHFQGFWQQQGTATRHPTATTNRVFPGPAPASITTVMLQSPPLRIVLTRQICKTRTPPPQNTVAWQPILRLTLAPSLHVLRSRSPKRMTTMTTMTSGCLVATPCQVDDTRVFRNPTSKLPGLWRRTYRPMASIHGMTAPRISCPRTQITRSPDMASP